MLTKILRIVGIALAAIGLVLVCAPTLVHDPGPAADTWEAIERRVRWGALIGFGALLIARTKLRPLRDTFAHAILWVVGGYLVARLIGLALDGIDSTKQWIWVGVEVVLVLIPALYLRRRAAKNASPPGP